MMYINIVNSHSEMIEYMAVPRSINRNTTGLRITRWRRPDIY